jgi:hypothetical protein
MVDVGVLLECWIWKTALDRGVGTSLRDFKHIVHGVALLIFPFLSKHGSWHCEVRSALI